MNASIISFQKLINDGKLLMHNKSLDKIIQNFKCFLIQNDKDNYIDNKKIQNESKTIIIDRIIIPDSIFVVILDYTILFITDISILPEITNNFDKSIIYTLAENIESNFPNNFQRKIHKYDKMEKSNLYEAIKQFSNYFILNENKNKAISEIWSLILPSFTSYFLYKNQRKLQILDNDFKRIKFEEKYFIPLYPLGCGSAALSVELVFHIETEELFVIKAFKNSESFQREYESYGKIHHPSIPNFYGRIKNQDKIIIEYIRGKTLDNIRCDELSDEDRYYIIFQMMILFEYFHFNELVYRDLKPNNLIVDEKMKITLIDYDVMIDLNNVKEDATITTNFNHLFTCPELRSEQKNAQYSVKMDIYSICIMMYYIFFNKTPKYCYNEKFNSKNVSFDQFTQQYRPLEIMCEECAKTEQSDRPSISKLIDYFINYLYEPKSEDIPSINEYKFYPMWIQNKEKIKALFKKRTEKLSDEENNNKYFENYFEEADKFHLFFQFSLGLQHYQKEYFKDNINKFIHYLSLLSNENISKSIFYLGYIYSEGVYISRDINKSIQYLTLAANQNHRIAQIKLGIIYYEGEYISRDINKSIHYFTLAAKQNDPDAQYYLGIIYYEGEYISQDINKSIQYLTLAARQNHRIAQNKLGIIYYEGEYISRDIDKSIHYFTLAAKQNHPGAQNKLGIIYYEGKYIIQDIDKSIQYFTLAANQNHPGAQNKLGIIYYEGEYISRDINKSIHYFTLSARQNHRIAQNKLGIIYYEGKYISRDINKSIQYLTLAAKQNDPDAQYNLGLIYYEGEYISRDINKSIHYFTLAAKQNDPDAQNKLGIIYYEGEYISRDINKSIHYFTLSARQNHRIAQNKLGIIYYEGEYISRDIDKSIHYFTLAAKQNDPDAQYYLGIIYYEGKYISRDIDKSIHYFTLAAKKNDPDAQYNLGLIYYEGEYISRDINKSIHYFTLAAKQNDPDAQFSLALFYLSRKIIEKATKYFNLAAYQNDKNSLFYLALFNLTGLYMKKNPYNGIEYLNQCLDIESQFFIESNFMVGYFHHVGIYVKRDIKKAIKCYKEASSFNHSLSKNNLGIIYKHGIDNEIKKEIGWAIEYFKEAIKYGSHSISMYNLAHLYFYEDPIENSNEESIKLLIKSSNNYHHPSAFLLCIVSIYEFGNDISDIIRGLNKIETISIELTNSICDIIEYNQLYETSILKEKYEQYRDIDFIFDFDFFFSEFSKGTDFLENGIRVKDESPKENYGEDINSDFYEGFGI